jgi:S1-C subfamily serine protease
MQPLAQSQEPTQPEPTTTNQSSEMPTHKRMGRVPFAILTATLCLLLGFAGPLVFWATGWLTKTSMVNSETVVSQEGDVIATVASKVSASVVSIVTESSARTYYGYSTTQQSAGTGIIISADGYIMTNKHVVSTTTKSIQVVSADGTTYKDVSFVGSDPNNDVSFIKIKGVTDLKAVTLGDSSAMKVGQKVVAIGNALGEYQNTVTTGIISALGRPVTAGDSTGAETEQLENLIQTDAAINSGNSGGPLVNLSGEVIGMNTAVATDAQGIGFAIPINDVKGMVKTLLASGKVEKPYLGVRYISITPDVATEYSLSVKNGAYIVAGSGQASIVSGSPADKAGLKEKDIITKVDGTNVDSTHPFASLIAQHSVGDKVTITYLRDGKESTVTVTLAVAS